MPPPPTCPSTPHRAACLRPRWAAAAPPSLHAAAALRLVDPLPCRSGGVLRSPRRW
uniref:Uncharacterized protein n=1 Tax=Arundo donax TaxID=35708 RepID=A0A0A8XPH6_ARUDO